MPGHMSAPYRSGGTPAPVRMAALSAPSAGETPSIHCNGPPNDAGVSSTASTGTAAAGSANRSAAGSNVT
jgi:hypothetical protein